MRLVPPLALLTVLSACGTVSPAPVRTPAPAETPVGTPAATPVTRLPPVSAAPREYTVAFGGDVHFEGVLRARLDRDPGTVFGPVAKVLRKADLAMVNVETAITEGGTRVPGKKYAFRAPATAFTALKAAGIDVVTMANNHGMDYQRSGLADTLAAIRRAKYPVVGIGRDAKAAYRPFRETVNGNRVAVVGATQVIDEEHVHAWSATGSQGGLASAKNEARLLKEVRKVRKDSDTVIVYLHWGTESKSCPNPAQRALAPRLVKAGADVIVGSHAHVLLGGGFLGRAYVAYGLGDFLWYDPGPTGVLTLTIKGRKVLKDRWTPAAIRGGVPVPLTGAARARGVADWKALRSCAGLSAR
ncbi:CapA family protein [Nonomuraea longicatena]|uniref:CapA family protein n=1 Tax=Nonomuraea longicatena TaxID=83682 RepID=A0ABP4BSJ7_9ACTN